MSLIGKLTEVMFYVGLAILIPAIYGYWIGEAIWESIMVCAIILILPTSPVLVPKLVKWFHESVTALFRKEIPWNYVKLIDAMKPKVAGELNLGEALVLTSLAWLIIPAICAYPYSVSGYAPVDSYFESMSGWTSTGLSLIEQPENLPKSMLLFRSITQWVGGLGIIIFVLAVLRGLEAKNLLKAEGRETIGSSIASTVKTYWKIYFGLSLLGVIALFYSGFDLFNAVNLTMSGISNGGFFPFSHYDFNGIQEFVLAGTMFVGATSFVFFNNLLHRKFKKAFLDEELVFYILVLLSAILLILYVGKEDGLNTIFNSVSAIACGGFSIGNIAIMHTFSKYVIILLMFCGGMYGSTTGAVKIWRILVVLKSIWVKIKTSFLPTGAVNVIKINNKPVEYDAVIESAIFIFSYAFIVVISTGVFIALGYGDVDSLFLVASSLGNVGLSTFSLLQLGTISKGFLIVLMYLGRIEIFPSLALARFLINFIKR
ncbi:hypothetical protein KJ780_01960 [Candidatus Micrarchaeota archaeon]|nr:hypothetical protein [Candidatus Micrarchaeota archaeon]